jgi:hypothetical protein
MMTLMRCTQSVIAFDIASNRWVKKRDALEEVDVNFHQLVSASILNGILSMAEVNRWLHFHGTIDFEQSK